MYQKNVNKWWKHWDFILLDLIFLQLAYVFSCMARNGWDNPYRSQVYLNVGIIICLADICAVFFMETYHGVIRRGYFLEFKNVIQHVAVITAAEITYLFLSKNSAEFSRISFLIFFLSATILLYAERLFWKHYILRYKKLFYKKGKVLVAVSSGRAEGVLRQVLANSYNEFEIIGIALTDRTAENGMLQNGPGGNGTESGGTESFSGVPAVCAAGEIPSYIQTKWVDSIFVYLDRGESLPEGLLETCVEMGVTVHCHFAEFENTIGTQQIGKVGGYEVLTTSLRMVHPSQVFIKRGMDILGSLVGLVLTGILLVFLGPAIYMASPGPVFFAQTRIGKNGKRFKLYKFRSMYMDAEKRKLELMEKNQMQGLMFKMEADPRIIGSGPDGTKHGIGWFIRKTSLDEFPQFWNVLKGEMSLVGTRPPTVDEWNRYERYHRARMSTKPGITGMWQVSGRSDITDFEEVVRLDMKYISEWNVGMDLKILFKTVAVVALGVGSK